MPLPSNKLFTPGFRLIADKVGSYIDWRNYLRLGNYLTLADNTADPSAVIDVDTSAVLGLLPANSGAVAGRAMTPVLIDDSPLTASNLYTSPSWAADLYGELDLLIKVTTGAQSGVIALTGLTGTYAQVRFTNDGTNPAQASESTWTFYPYANGFMRAVMDIGAGSIRTLEGRNFLGSLHSSGYQNGTHTDTTSGVTGLTVTFGGNVTGRVKLRGIPK